MTVSRRQALQLLATTTATAAATAALPRPVHAAKGRTAPEDVRASILFDATRCVGCRECTVACSEAKGWEDPAQLHGDSPALTQDAPTAILRFDGPDGMYCFKKEQCMHCLHPACVSACMLSAMRKDEDGAVVWKDELCIGCRYCQVACPFTIPRFEWDSPMPALTKCDLCAGRRAEGLGPACVAECRMGALAFGTRDQMLEVAHRRLAERPDQYNPTVFGELEAGGTAVVHLTRAGVDFADLGFPPVGTRSVPELPETVQHTIYKGFAAPIALFAVLGAAVRRNSRKLHQEEAKHHKSDRPTPVGGKLVTPTTIVLAILTLLGIATVLWRLAVGLGPTTNLNDGYAKGLWIAMNVVTGTALACGGYGVALLVYVANRGKYHPLVRPALLTSAFGYTLGGLSVLIDIGRAWNFWRLAYFWEWNFNSILLEVALCITLYTAVLWIEVSPAVLETWRDSRVNWLKRMALFVSPRIEKSLPYLIALGLVLPTMHQSSLGSLMMMAGHKLHPLWQTPFLPLLFLVSVLGIGYAGVTIESTLSARTFKRPRETPMLRTLAVPMAGALLAYSIIRIAEIAWVGELHYVTRMDGHSLLFLMEMTLLTVPAFGLIIHRKSAEATHLVGMAVMVVLGGALYRFSSFIFAFNPGPGWSYFPSIPEFTMTIGFISAQVLGYVLMVKLFPILRGAEMEAGQGDSHPSHAGGILSGRTPEPQAV